MKKTIAILLVLAALLPTVSACGEADGSNTSDTVIESVESEETSPQINSVSLVRDGQAGYAVVRSDLTATESPETQASLTLRRTLESTLGVPFKIGTDWLERDETVEQYANVYEILVGHTNRPETEKAIANLEKGEFVIAVDGTKIVICGYDEASTQRGVAHFIRTYLPQDGTAGEVELPADLFETVEATYFNSMIHDKEYTEMGDVVLQAFTGTFYRRGILTNANFWDAAEILESYIDAYEQTGREDYLEYITQIAKVQGARETTSWLSNEYNDDIAWMCIAYARIYLLTGDELYLNISKNNFDDMYARAISDDLGGGLFWRADNQTKNSCINCPASIAACLLGKALEDDSYYEKAKGLMQWEFDNMFVASTGAVYDSYNLKGEINKWSSSYNQGTFIGACTLLHEKYGDEIYLTNAAAAADYSMNRLENVDGVLNGENSGGDLIGFKGILTRWLYRYAKYTDDTDILMWLQNNADTAFSNRNVNDLIWTTWANKTPDDIGDMDLFGFSTAMALMFNCQPWGEE